MLIPPVLPVLPLVPRTKVPAVILARSAFVSVKPPLLDLPRLIAVDAVKGAMVTVPVAPALMLPLAI